MYILAHITDVLKMVLNSVTGEARKRRSQRKYGICILISRFPAFEYHRSWLTELRMYLPKIFWNNGVTDIDNSWKKDTVNYEENELIIFKEP